MAIPYTFGIVGAGYRAELLVEVAKRLPDQLTLAGAAVRRPEVADAVGRAWGAPVFSSPEELVRKVHPDFVLTCVPRSVNPEIIRAVVELGTPVLSETPPAADLDAMRSLWAEVGKLGLVQVGEQYLMYPGHSARLEVAHRALIGQVTSVEVSSTHGYHAVSMMRGMLGAAPGPVKVRVATFRAPLADPLTRQGWSGDDSPKDAKTVIATLDFGGRYGLYNFTDNQWHNRLRSRRIVIRGSHGEIVDDDVVRLAAPKTIVRSRLVRSQLGYDLNLDGYDTEHISFEGDVVYRNPFLGARLMDDEIADAALMTATAAWAKDEGPPPYPLAEGCEDHLVSLAIEEAAITGQEIVTTLEDWAR